LDIVSDCLLLNWASLDRMRYQTLIVRHKSNIIDTIIDITVK